MPYGFSGLNRPVYYRSVFLSDFHMGAKSFDARALVDFLRSFHTDKLYLVGDIVDGWKLNKRWYWTEDCNCVLDEIAKKIDAGTRVIYLPGNHDEEVRKLLPIMRYRFASKIGIEIKDKTVHRMLDGRKFLVLHGDQFDRKILKGPLSRWGDYVYDFFMDLLGTYRSGPRILISGKLKPFSLAKAMSKHSQKALHLLNNFEAAVHKAVKQRGLDGLICGHTHIPVIKAVQDITYANSGSWLRSGHTALIETHDGALELIDCPSSYSPPLLSDTLFSPACTLVPCAKRYRPATEKILYAIKRIWPEKTASKTRAPFEPLEIHKVASALIPKKNLQNISTIPMLAYASEKATLFCQKLGDQATLDLITSPPEANYSVQISARNS